MQTTTDLAGFWERLYPQVRRELMRRYPRHAWPEPPTSVNHPRRQCAIIKRRINLSVLLRHSESEAELERYQVPSHGQFETVFDWTGACASPNHTWQEYTGYSIYSAEQERSLWNKHTHDATQITIASNPAYVRAEWQGTAGRSAPER